MDTYQEKLNESLIKLNDFRNAEIFWTHSLWAIDLKTCTRRVILSRIQIVINLRKATNFINIPRDDFYEILDLGVDELEFEQKYEHPFPSPEKKVIFYDLIGHDIRSNALMWENRFQNEGRVYKSIKP